jgi:peptidoglycan/xylan/chitin deacetylase (PgdA/CDA1 family)
MLPGEFQESRDISGVSRPRHQFELLRDAKRRSERVDVGRNDLSAKAKGAMSGDECPQELNPPAGTSEQDGNGRLGLDLGGYLWCHRYDYIGSYVEAAILSDVHVHSLMYHEVYAQNEEFQPQDSYGVSVNDFAAHMRAIEREVRTPPVSHSSINGLSGGGHPWLLTFDDGRVGSLRAADVLDLHGWKGHFFIVTDLIGTEGYLSADQIRDLERRGHIVGSHSASHPASMSSLPSHRLDQEWDLSTKRLAGLLGRPIDVAAIPGGSYSRGVASAAAQSGIKTLFTSEPTSKVRLVDGCMVIGRFAVRSSTTGTEAAALVRGSMPLRVKQFIGWNTRKALKAVSGRHYHKVRARLLRTRSFGR